jgi:hypothetical protein
MKKTLPSPGRQGTATTFCRNRRGNRNRWNNAVAASAASGKFEGKTAALTNDIFDNTGPHDTAQFHRSLNNIINHLQLSAGHDVSEAIRQMVPATIIIPPAPTPTVDANGNTAAVSSIEEFIWKESLT